MTDPIRAELEALVAACDEHGGMWPDHHVQALFDAVERARATLAAEPTLIASEPSDEDLADLAEVFNGDPIPAMRRALELWGRPTISALAAEPPAPAPAASFAARLRQCPSHGQLPANAWACPECVRELREELARLRAPAVDGEREEREELAQWLDEEAKRCAAQFHDRITRAAALLREARPQPVPADLTPVAYDAMGEFSRQPWDPLPQREVVYDDAWRLLSRRQRAEEVERLCTKAGIDLRSPGARRLVQDAKNGMPLYDVRDLIKHWNATVTTEPPTDD